MFLYFIYNDSNTGEFLNILYDKNCILQKTIDSEARHGFKIQMHILPNNKYLTYIELQKKIYDEASADSIKQNFTNYIKDMLSEKILLALKIQKIYMILMQIKEE